MNSELRELYQDIILDHGRRPRNFSVMANPSREAHGHNPLCGDTVTVYLRLGEDERVERVQFQGHGCAISMASASIMSEVLVGKDPVAIEQLFAEFQSREKGGAAKTMPPALEEDMERLMPLTGVSNYPSRVKCAILPWHAAKQALAGGADAVKTED